MKTRLWLLSCVTLLVACGADRSTPESPDATDAERGPHGGRVLRDGSFALELAIFESGVPPEFHAWATDSGAAVLPAEVSLSIELMRLGGETDRIEFAPQRDYLRGTSVVHEPHSFDVAVVARHGGRDHRFSYAAYEGRTTIAIDVAQTAGIETATAGPGELREDLPLYGSVVADATRVREVRARFPGVLRAVNRQIGDRVQSGETLATVEANDSLQTYAVTAPISGVITERHAAAGEQTDADALFTIADFSTVWAELDVFARDRPRLHTGLPVDITADGERRASGTIAYLAPTGNRASQSTTARVVLENTDGRWTPGQFVAGRVKLGTTPLPLAVPLAAIQTFRDRDVVFAQVGETYEVRMLTLGRRDSQVVEVLDGLSSGTTYVSGNSYLIKADIEKSGASHDH